MSAGPEKELSDLARALGRLAPQPANLQRDRILFAAGERRGRRAARVQLAGNLALLSVCCFLGYQLWIRPTPTPEVRILTVHVPQSVPMPLPPPAPQEEAPEYIEPPKSLYPPVIVGSEYPPSYGKIQRNIPYYEDRALPYSAQAGPDALDHDGPARVGSRPGFADSLQSILPWR